MKLKKILKGKLSEDELNALIQSYDVVGDIAILIIPPDLEHREHIIGNTILDTHPTIKVVAKRVGNYGGELRTIQLQIIAGENRKETVHKEFGITFRLNPESVYFSVRSSTERKRIADLVTPGENILVMFSGIAPYPLYIAKFSKADKVIGIEKNNAAHLFAEKNILLNKIQGRIHLYNGDVREIVPQLKMDFDRIAMPLPKNGQAYLPLALNHLKPDGYIHHYIMQQPETIHQAIIDLENACKKETRSLTRYDITICGHTAPKTYRYCIDAQIH